MMLRENNFDKRSEYPKERNEVSDHSVDRFSNVKDNYCHRRRLAFLLDRFNVDETNSELLQDVYERAVTEIYFSYAERIDGGENPDIVGKGIGSDQFFKLVLTCLQKKVMMTDHILQNLRKPQFLIEEYLEREKKKNETDFQRKSIILELSGEIAASQLWKDYHEFQLKQKLIKVDDDDKNSSENGYKKTNSSSGYFSWFKKNV